MQLIKSWTWKSSKLSNRRSNFIELSKQTNSFTREVAHQGPSSTEVSSSHGGTQWNGDYCFLRGEEWSKWILVATHQVHLDPTIVSFSFSVSLIVAQFTIFSNFSGPKLPEPFWGPKRPFLGNLPPTIFLSKNLLFRHSPQRDLSNGLSCTSNGDNMTKSRPRESTWR